LGFLEESHSDYTGLSPEGTRWPEIWGRNSPS